MEDISVDIDDVVEIWELADMYHQLEGLKFSCMGCMAHPFQIMIFDVQSRPGIYFFVKYRFHAIG